ncbi:hypothetical protein NKJ04_17495 [Mesorhizobium sp. M0618]|uniref:hypothetical protein n=1 Tax=Mesorhizobium sp. M0618 TaxID=2956972 RepID=UPI00333A8EB7
MTKINLFPLTISPNEITLQNDQAVDLLLKGRLVQVPAGTTVYLPDTGTYDFRVVENDYYTNGSFQFVVSDRVPDDGTAGRVVVDRSAEISSQQATLCQIIDEEAEAFRSRFITPGSGQSMTYEEKYEEALLVQGNLDIADEQVPHIMAEIGITGSDKASVAARIITVRNQWRGISAGIEKLRLGSKRTVNANFDADSLLGPPMVDWQSVLS